MQDRAAKLRQCIVRYEQLLAETDQADLVMVYRAEIAAAKSMLAKIDAAEKDAAIQEGTGMPPARSKLHRARLPDADKPS